jgi:hypothetical protein
LIRTAPLNTGLGRGVPDKVVGAPGTGRRGRAAEIRTMEKTSLLVVVDGKELVNIDGGASMDISAFLSRVRASVHEVRTNTAIVKDNLLLGSGNTIAVQQS